MSTDSLVIYGILAIPFLVSMVAGYAKLRFGPFFGVALAAGALSVLFSYLAFDLMTALIQAAMLALGVFIFLLTVGVFGERFSYRSPMLLLGGIGLFPLGMTVALQNYAPLIVFGSILVVNILFAILLAYLRRNTTMTRTGAERPKNRYVLAVPMIASTVIVALMFMVSLGVL